VPDKMTRRLLLLEYMKHILAIAIRLSVITMNICVFVCLTVSHG
jgi:hypothetical protein